MSETSSSPKVVQFPKSERQRAHAARMFAWEDQVRKDTELNKSHPYALHVVVLFRKRMNHAGETGRIEYGWIGKTLGISRSTVRDAVAALIERNHLGTESGKSVGKGSIYRAKIGEGVRQDVHPGCTAGSTPGVRQGVQGVYGTPYTRISSVESSISESGERASHGRTKASGNAASGYRGKQAGRFERKADGAVAERAVSRMLGNDGDDVLAVLFGSEKGRPLYQQLIETARVGGVNAHLIKKARMLYWDLTPARNLSEAAAKQLARLQDEIAAEEFEGTTIEGEATECD